MRGGKGTGGKEACWAPTASKASADWSCWSVFPAGPGAHQCGEGTGGQPTWCPLDISSAPPSRQARASWKLLADSRSTCLFPALSFWPCSPRHEPPLCEPVMLRAGVASCFRNGPDSTYLGVRTVWSAYCSVLSLPWRRQTCTRVTTAVCQ